MKRIRVILMAAGMWLGWQFGQEVPTAAQTVTPTPETGITPNTLLLYRADLYSGKETAYEQTEAAIARGYEKAKIPVYWITLQSVTDTPHVLYFDGFDTFDEIEQTGGTLAKGLEAHPDIAALQKKLQDSVSGTRTVMAFRRDDLGYRLNKIDLSKSHFVRVSIFQLRAGYEDDFADAVRNRARSFESGDVDAPSMVYQVHSGLPLPAFIEFQPMNSLSEIDDALDRTKKNRRILSDTRQLPPGKWMKDAELQIDTQIYSINSSMSHWPPVEASAVARQERPAASKNEEVAARPEESPANGPWCCTPAPPRRAVAATGDDESPRE